MARLLLLLITAAICTDGGLSISCFSRSGSTDDSNGTAISCGDFPYCYSYSNGLERFAGCSRCTGAREYYYGGCSNTICTLGMDCQVCSSDFCNAVSPSSISCFYRSGMSYSANDNGTKVTCHSGVTTCYSYMSGSYSYAGCGDCSTRNDPSCVTCNSTDCNTMAPSAISCYAGTQNYGGSSGPGGSLSNGTAVECPTGVTSCFSRLRTSSYSISFTFGCGACNSTDNPTCVTCSTDLCNSVTPSAISCNFQTLSDRTYTFSHGYAVVCPSGITSCYSAMISKSHRPHYDYGCGSCSADVMPSCVNCATDNCNTADRTDHTCYSHIPNPFSTRTMTVACTGGIKSCYTLTKPIIISNNQFNIPMSGCGVCTPTSTALYGCTSCNTSNCNAPANSSSSLPTTHSTPPSNAPVNSGSSQPATLSTPPPGQSNPTANPAITAPGIGCYQSFSKNKKTEQQKTSCPSYSSCFDYTFKSGSDRFYISGCGSCPFSGGSDGSTCRTCHSNYCNSAQSRITCYSSFGGSRKDKKELDCPSSTSCFHYSYSYNFGMTEFFFAGCGNCSFSSDTTTCRTCFTDLCNSGSRLGSRAFTAAAAAAVVFCVMLLSYR
ncbi:hypothetical protein BOX15_Mlig014447g1 [Macrostomum lignano]|uniref:TNFR-Cys domain-containing protein n=1 Tax=Macrostomum lignano TaxID=282301 RepID=A0A267H8D5_9PLAT|nr:hypothetical protein BOX15_Mlig014447g1 [Macrostomum lignano]